MSTAAATTIAVLQGEFAPIKSLPIKGISLAKWDPEQKKFIDASLILQKIKDMGAKLYELGEVKFKELVSEFLIEQVGEIGVMDVLSFIYTSLVGTLSEEEAYKMLAYLQLNEGKIYLDEKRTMYGYPLMPDFRKLKLSSRKIDDFKNDLSKNGMTVLQTRMLFARTPIVRFVYKDNRSEVAHEIQPLGLDMLGLKRASNTKGIFGSVFKVVSSLAKPVVAIASQLLTDENLKSMSEKDDIVSCMCFLGENVTIYTDDPEPSTGLLRYIDVDPITIKAKVKGNEFSDTTVDPIFQEQNLQIMAVIPKQPGEKLATLQIRSVRDTHFVSSGALLNLSVELSTDDVKSDTCSNSKNKIGYINIKDMHPLSSRYELLPTSYPQLLECMIKTDHVDNGKPEIFAFDVDLKPSKIFENWSDYNGQKVQFKIILKLADTGNE